MRPGKPNPLLIAGVIAILAAACFLRGPDPGTQSVTAAPIADFTLQPDERRLVELFDHTAKAVVFISNNAVRRDFFSLDVFEVRQGTGSGFVWDKQGHIVTNYHVVGGADSITVTMDDQSIYRAEVVGTAPDKDLAVLRIRAPAEKLTPLVVGRSDIVKVGMTAFAIGNPFGLDRSLTKGIVSALGREIRSLTGRTITDVIQTDAAVNPGNSGGPLLNSAGQLIGVNTAIVSRSGSSSGVGFAVPSNTVYRVVQQIIKFGRVIQPGLGINYFSDEIARRWKIRRGVILRKVFPRTAAAAAGLRGTDIDYRSGEVRLGDIILKVEDEAIEDTEDLLNALDRHQVGEIVEITYQRDGDVRTAKVRLQQVN